MSVVIVGGGFAGLFAATAFRLQGIHAEVLEASSTPGGLARTIHSDGFIFEPAVSSYSLPNPALDALLGAIAVDSLPAAASGRFVVRNGRMVPTPSSPSAALTSPILSPAAKLRIVLEPFLRSGPLRPDETLQSFFERRLGRTAGAVGATIAANGVYAGDPDQLCTAAAYPALAAVAHAGDGSLLRGAVSMRKMRKAAGAPRQTLHVPAGGMAALADRVADSLGDSWRPSVAVHEIRPDGNRWVLATSSGDITARRLIVTLAPQVAADLFPDALAGVLRRGPSCAPVAVVGLGLPGDLEIPHGFGVLVGPNEDLTSLGMLFESRVAPDRAPAGRHLVRAMVGGALEPDRVEWSDDQLVAGVEHDLSTLLSTPVRSDWSHVVRHLPGIPQYGVGHSAWLGELATTLENLPSLDLAGWGYRGVGLAHLAADAIRLTKSSAGVSP